MRLRLSVAKITENFLFGLTVVKKGAVAHAVEGA
jgi:hypothetical protein